MWLDADDVLDEKNLEKLKALKTSLDDIVEDFNALLANLRDAGILER